MDFVIVIVHDGLQTYSPFSSVGAGQQISKGQFCIIALIVIFKKGLKVWVSETKATIWPYWSGITLSVKFIDFSATVLVMLM